MSYRNKADSVAYQANYYRKNLKKIKARAEANKQKKAEYDAAYYAKYYSENREKIIARTAKYQAENREKENARNRMRQANDPQFAIKRRLFSRVKSAMKNKKKTFSTIAVIGCTVAEFMEHIQNQFKPGMNWNNRKLWHIDHILPCSSFDLTDEAQVRQCFHFTNMQPLWASENISKGDKLPKQHQPSLLL